MSHPQSPLLRFRASSVPNITHAPTIPRHRSNLTLAPRLRYIALIFLTALLITTSRRTPHPVHAAPAPVAESVQSNTPVFKALVSAWSLLSSQRTSNQKVSHLANDKKIERRRTGVFDPEHFTSRQDRSSETKSLSTPEECAHWRQIAKIPNKLQLYRHHFNSHDVIDWFVYAAVFDEEWHMRQLQRPTYLDIAANHARRWSSTWFLDRCMGWEGVCVEPNQIYWEELQTERHCHVVPTCLSDRERRVNFSYTAAYGGVVAQRTSEDMTERLGVNAGLHKSKYARHFQGVREIKCTTVDAMLMDWPHAGSNKQTAHHFDFMSLDVEGHELPILQGIDWSRTTIDVIVTENRGGPVISLLNAQGYDRFPGVLKDDIWVRRGSKLKINQTIVGWMKYYDRLNYSFKDMESASTLV